MRLSSITELSAATLALLAIPVTARPYNVPLDSCLKQVAANAPCVDALGLQSLLAVSKEDLHIFAVGLAHSGCTANEAEETTLAVQTCLDMRDAALSNTVDSDSGSGSEDLRRRKTDEPHQAVRTRGSLLARASTDFNVTVASCIVGVVLGLAAFSSAVTICFCCLRESSRKKKAMALADAKEAEKAAAKAAAKARGRK